MKFKLSSATLCQRLQTVSHVVNPKSNLSLLTYVLFEVEDGKLRLTGSDGDLSLISIIDLDDYDSNGRFALPAGNLVNGLREMGDQPITIEVDLQNFSSRLEYLNGYSRFVAFDASAYPVPAPMEGDFRQAYVPAETLLGGISRAMFATSDDPQRPVMGGIYCDMSDADRPGLTFVASDGHKLFREYTDLARIDQPGAFTLPKKPAKLLKEILTKEPYEVDVRFSAGCAEFRLIDYTLFCRLIDKPYPNYRSVVPEDNPYHVHLDRAALQSALRRVMAYGDTGTGLLRLRVTEGEVVLSGENIDYTTSAEERVACDYNGTPMLIGFKGFFLIDILATIPSQEVVLQLADPSRAGLIVPAEQEEHEEILMLLMPMMVN